MKLKYRAISADSHINEPPDLWERRLPARYKERAPHVIDTPSGSNAWVVEGAEKPLPLGFNAVNYRAQKRYDRYEFRKKFEEYRFKGVRFDNILPGSFDPVARLQEIDEDKVDAEVLYNGAQLWPAIKNLQDRAFSLACFKAYNDWIAEFESVDPNRLIGVGTLPATGIDDAIAELQRCVKELGLRTVALESYPSGSYTDACPEDDRFWAVAEEIGIPIALHKNFSIPAGAARVILGPLAVGKNDKFKDMSPVSGSFQTVLSKLILTGVFDRFPNLKFIGAEVNCGWIPFYLEQFDDRYRRYHYRQGPKLDLLPSEYFRRNVYATFILDQVGVDNRYLSGVANLMWSSDFPHSVSNWPIDTELGREQLQRAGATGSESDRMMWQTCAKLYGLPYAG
jgi:predicted TIM-barrel fold metal-dependent hydrolase